MVDFIADSTSALANSNVIKMKRYKLEINYNKIKLTEPDFKSEEIKLQEYVKFKNSFIILKENNIFFSTVQSIKIFSKNSIESQKLFLIMSKLQTKFDPKNSNCRFFFTIINNNNNFNIYSKIISDQKKRQRKLNIFCFPNRNHSKTFDKLFEKTFENFLMNVKSVENLNFYEKSYMDNLFVRSIFEQQNYSKNNQLLNQSQWKYISLNKNKIFITQNKDLGRIKFYFKSNEIINCELNSIKKGKTLCIVVIRVKKGKILSNLKICPSESSIIKRIIEFIYLKFNLRNSCNIEIKSSVMKLLKIGTNFKEILAKFKPFSENFLNNIISSQLKKFILFIKTITENQRVSKLKTLKELLTSAGDNFINNFKSKNIEAGNFIDELLKSENIKITKKKILNNDKIAKIDNSKLTKTQLSNNKYNIMNIRNTDKLDIKNTYKKDKKSQIVLINSNSSLNNSNEDSIFIIKNMGINKKKGDDIDLKSKSKANSNFTNQVRDQILFINKDHSNKIVPEIDFLNQKNYKIKDKMFEKDQGYFNLTMINDASLEKIDNKLIMLSAPPLKLNDKYNSYEPETDSFTTIDNQIIDFCDKNDIYCLCKNHPQYKECICSVFPMSVICMKNYCIEHSNDYECNPSVCDNEEFKTDKCYCKNNLNDIKCKCMTNPYSRECFCTKNPLSHLCNKKICHFNPNSLFCSCSKNHRPLMCEATYCVENPLNPYCKCIVNPFKDECKCLNDPITCSKSEFMEAIVEYDLKIRDAYANNKLFYSINPNQHSNLTNKKSYILKKEKIDPFFIDPQAIYNMYYPPCRYDPDRPNHTQTEPCIPFPEPKQCVNNRTSEPIKKLKISNKSKKQCAVKNRIQGFENVFKNKEESSAILGHNNKLFIRISADILIQVNNKSNYKNVLRTQKNKDFMMLYNKLLLFNNKCKTKNNNEATNSSIKI